MLNRVVLIGNITKDTELTTTSSGISLCRFDIAVNRPFDSNGERKVDYFNCTSWRGTAEAVAKYCKKGSKICVVGSVQTRTYEDNDGKKRTVYDIAVQEVEFLTAKSNAETAEFETKPTLSTNAPTTTQTNVFEAKKQPTLQFVEGDEDIPF